MSESDPEIAPIASDASPSDNRESPAAGLNTPVVNEPAINPTADTSPPSAPGHAWVGKRIGDRYDIDRLIGQGGMGAVYKGRHIHMRKTVAIKVLLPEMTAHPEAVARFEREAIASARIAHHNVVAATDFGQLPDGSFFLVLDFVDGRSLSDTIHEEGILNPRRAIRIAEQVAAALEAAHQQNIFHRDLKPDNIMLIQKPESSELVKVLDFGIAKMETVGEEKNLTRAGVIFGTPQYMAPEQAAGQPVDGRSDLYALGIVLYEMLGGNAPFDSEELVAILTKQITQEPDPLPESIDPNIRKIVMKLLEKQPDARSGAGA